MGSFGPCVPTLSRMTMVRSGVPSPFDEGVVMAAAGTAVAAVAAKNPQVPASPRFSPAAQVAVALLRVAVGLHLPVDVPGQVLRSRLPHDRAWTHGGWTTWFLTGKSN